MEYKAKILLVDDRPENLYVLENILERPNLLMVKANSGNEALSLVLEHEFALILLDVQMPGMDGFETAELLRGIEKTRHLPIIFITAINKDEQYIFKGYQSGAVDYLFKPLQPEILKSKVAVFLDLYRQQKIVERQAIELEHVNKELSDFAFIVSHDLKAPLRAIRSLANWIATDYADKFDAQGKEQMALLMSRVERLHALINGVLQYSRAGRIKENVESVDLNDILAEVIDLIVPPAHITVVCKNPLPTLSIERTRISQVFQNLLSNAIKYMDKPVGEVRIGCTEIKDEFRFSVEDNGPGIDQRYFTKIFQIFQTLHPKDDVESTGVGLTLVKKIIELYGGNVWLESQVGMGSTFYFTLPKNGHGDYR